MTTVELAARLDRLPLSRFHRRVLYGLAFGFFFELADLNTFGYAAPGLEKYLDLSIDDIAHVTSFSFAGMFLGAAVGGRLADAFGRRRTLLAAVAWYSVWSLVNAAMWNVPSLIAARLLTGIGLGAMTVVAITYLSETMPRELRGRMQGAVLASGLLGIPVMAFFARAVVPTGPNGWRFVFLFGALGLFALMFIARLPESPRWLLQHRGSAAAEATVRAIEDETASDVGPLPERERTATAPPEERQRVAELLQPPLRGRTAMLVVVWVFQTLGFYGFVTWVPILLVDHGFDLTKSLTFAAVTTIGAVPGALLAWPISDRFHRKVPAVIVSGLVAAAGLAYGLTFNPAAIMFFGFLVGFFIQTFAALMYAYTPELFPTALRNSGSGFVYGVGRLANIVGPLIVAAIFHRAGYGWVFVYIAACWMVVGLTIALFGPRSGQVALEDLQGAAPADDDRTIDLRDHARAATPHR